jgi:hypothetical protein
MPPVSGLTSQQVNTANSGGWSGELRFALCPNDVVFVAEVAETITNAVFIEFDWDNATVGAYTDVNPGQTFFITETDDPAELRRPLFRGRVTRSPTATVFYCNESSFNLQAGYIITVIDSYEILQKDRSGALVDGYLAFEKLPPIVRNMQAFYYAESAGSMLFSFAPVGQAMEKSATIASYAWTIPGATYTVGNATTQNITVSIPYGHRWAFLDVEDSNGVSHRLIFQILVCPRDDPAFMFQAHDDVVFNNDIESGGLTVSTTFFAGIESILNRTRCAIVVANNYKSGSGTFSNVKFVGYIVQENTDILGDLVSSTLSQTGFELQSFEAIAAQLPVPPIAIRNVASEDAWDEINIPTPQRVTAHLGVRYSTLFELCPVDLRPLDDTWFSGETDMEGTTLVESINHTAEEFNARIVFYPEGDAALEINPNFQSEAERDAVPTLLASGSLGKNALFQYSLPLPYFDTVGQVEAGFATFYTDGTTPIKLAGIAPAVARQEGIETPVVLAQLLNSNLTQAQAIAAAKQRIGDLLEWSNPPVLIPFTMHDGWHFITPSLRVWLNFDLPGDDSTRGLAVPSTWRYLLLSIALTWHSDGTFDVSGSARLETQGGLAQVNVSISPNEVSTDLPVLPVLPDSDAFTPDGTQNYLTTDVPPEDVQPYSRYAVVQFTPMTTGDAANAADNMPDPSCQIITPSLNFKSSETRLTSAATVNGEPYTITVKGSARISAGSWTELGIDFEGSEESFAPIVTITDLAVYTPGDGWTRVYDVAGLGDSETRIFRTFADVTTFTRVRVRVTCDTTFIFAVSDSGGAINTDTFPAKNNEWIELSAVFTDDYLRLDLFADAGDFTLTFHELEAFGVGINPFTGDPGTGDLRGDAFYQWVVDAEGVAGAAELYPATRGLRINSAPVDPPPEFNPNSEYTFVHTGDGNQIPLRFELEDYSQAQNLPLYARVCGEGMGA